MMTKSGNGLHRAVRRRATTLFHPTTRSTADGGDPVADGRPLGGVPAFAPSTAAPGVVARWPALVIDPILDVARSDDSGPCRPRQRACSLSTADGPSRLPGGPDASRSHRNFRRSPESLAPQFAAAEPFPHVVVDGLLADGTMRAIIDSFPPPSPGWEHFDDPYQLKFALRDEEAMPPAIRSVIQHFNSQVFIEFLESLTGIRGLIPDPHLAGGGLHQIPRGGTLKIHADFNKHRRLHADRRLNVLLYLNEEWHDEYGGYLELWDRDMTRAVVRVAPVANRMVVFETTSDYLPRTPRCAGRPRGDVPTLAGLVLLHHADERPTVWPTTRCGPRARAAAWPVSARGSAGWCTSRPATPTPTGCRRPPDRRDGIRRADREYLLSTLPFDDTSHPLQGHNRRGQAGRKPGERSRRRADRGCASHRDRRTAPLRFDLDQGGGRVRPLVAIDHGTGQRAAPGLGHLGQAARQDGFRCWCRVIGPTITASCGPGSSTGLPRDPVSGWPTRSSAA